MPRIERACYWFCVVVGTLWGMASCDLIDFHVCIKPPGYCAQQPKEPTT